MADEVRYFLSYETDESRKRLSFWWYGLLGAGVANAGAGLAALVLHLV